NLGAGTGIAKSEVVLELAVFGATAHVQRRKPANFGVVDQPHNLVLPAYRLSPKDTIEKSRGLGTRPLRTQPADVESPRQTGRGGEPLWLPQGPFQSAVASHRQASDEGVGTSLRHAEERRDQSRQLLAQKAPIAAADRFIGVEAAVYLRHHHRHAERCDIPLDRRS